MLGPESEQVRGAPSFDGVTIMPPYHAARARVIMYPLFNLLLATRKANSFASLES